MLPKIFIVYNYYPLIQYLCYILSCLLQIQGDIDENEMRYLSCTENVDSIVKKLKPILVSIEYNIFLIFIMLSIIIFYS